MGDGAEGTAPHRREGKPDADTAQTGKGRGGRGPDGAREAAAFAQRIVAAVAAPYALDGHLVGIGTSIGIALSPQDGTDPAELLKKADLALSFAMEAVVLERGRVAFRGKSADFQADEAMRHRLLAVGR